MSTLISYDMKLNMPCLKIFAQETNTVILDANITGQLIEIKGEAKAPFVIGVRFVHCTIVAESLRSFENCYFDQTCKMIVENLPLCGIESINNNAVFCKNETS